MAKRIRRGVTIAANAVVDDQLQVDNVRLSQRTADAEGVVRLMAVESATGLRIALKVSSSDEASNLEPVIKATAPIYPDDVMYEGGILAGDEVALSVLNTTAGAITLFYDIELP